MGGFKGVGDHWMFALASRVYFSFMKAIWVVLGGRCVVMFVLCVGDFCDFRGSLGGYAST